MAKIKEAGPIEEMLTGIAEIPSTRIRTCDLCYKIIPGEQSARKKACEVLGILNSHSNLLLGAKGEKLLQKLFPDEFADKENRNGYRLQILCAERAYKKLTDECEFGRAILSYPAIRLLAELEEMSSSSFEETVDRVIGEREFIQKNLRKVLVLKTVLFNRGISSVQVQLEEKQLPQTVDFNRPDFPLLALRMALNQLASNCGRTKEQPVTGTQLYPQAQVLG